MDYTAPQRFLMEGKTLQDYEVEISEKPGRLERVIEQAHNAGFSINDLKSLYGFALRQGIIDMPTYKFNVGRLDLKKTRKVRKTGKIDPRDRAVTDEPGAVGRTVLCVGSPVSGRRHPECGRYVRATTARLGGRGWVCDKCSGKAKTGHKVDPVRASTRTSSGNITVDL
jgi:hypothetical protein